MSQTVERVVGLSPLAILRDYVRRGRPVVIGDEVRRWPALQRWSFEYLRARHGALRVEAEVGPGGADRVVFPMTLGEYLDRLVDPSETGLYLRHWEFWRDAPALDADQPLPAYLRDWLPLPRWIWPRMNWVFMGPKGSRTHLHIDSLGTHSWLAQLVGRKRWLLFPPAQRRLLAPRERRGGLGVLFDVDPDDPAGVDLARFPDYRNARPWLAETGPGDLIIVPAGWPHCVINLDATMALTGNFIAPGADLRAFVREGVGQLGELWHTRSARS